MFENNRIFLDILNKCAGKALTLYAKFIWYVYLMFDENSLDDVVFHYSAVYYPYRAYDHFLYLFKQI